MVFSYLSKCQIVFAKVLLKMQQPIRLIFSPGVSFNLRRSVQAFLEMFLTESTFHWRSVEESDALAIATPRIAAFLHPAPLFVAKCISHRRFAKSLQLSVLINALIGQVGSRTKMSGYPIYRGDGVDWPLQVFRVFADRAFGRAP